MQNRIEPNCIVKLIELNRSELAKIVLESNRKPMNHESNRFAVYSKIHSSSCDTSRPNINLTLQL